MIAQIAAMGQIQAKRTLPSLNIPAPKSVALSKLSTPYFERNNFIREEVNMQELSLLHELGFSKLTGQDLIETKVALNVIGYNPNTKLINLLIEKDILGFARPGLDHHPHLNFLSMLLPRLKRESGATHIALALPKSLQRLLDVFLITGEFLPNLSPVNLSDYGLKGENDYVALLKTARLAGYKLVAIEPDTPVRAFDPQREQIMARAIQCILQREGRAKVIFLAPERHLCYDNVGDWMPVAGILKSQGVNIVTVNQYWHSDFIPKVFACLLKELTYPMALASKDVKMFAALQSRSLSLEHILCSNWDLTIIYPRISTGKKRYFKQTILEMSRIFNANFLFGKRRKNNDELVG